MTYEELLNTKLNILLCDADARVLKRMNVWIKAMGENVYSTTSGIEALDIYSNKSIDIVILSDTIGEIGTVELIDKIKAYNADQVIVLIIKVFDSDIFKRSIELNVDKYLNAPVDAKTLFNVVETLAKEKLWHHEFIAQKVLLEEYKQAIDQSFIVSKHSSDGAIVYVNDAFCTLMFLDPKEALDGGKNPLAHENVVESRKLWEELRNKKVYKGRQEYIVDGNEVVVDINVVPILNKDNDIEEFLVFMNDVTEVVETGKKLEETQLRQKIEALRAQKAHNDAMSKMKDSFLTVFTHELRTPLNAIINFSDHVIKHLKKEEFAKKEKLVSEVVEIKQGGIIILDMINNVMSAIKLRDSKDPFVRADISFNDIITQSIQKFDYDLKNIELNIELPEKSIINSDADRLMQVCENLLSNAIKYGKGVIKISLYIDMESFSFVIEDNGEGIKENRKIFELFEQSDDDTMTRTTQGTGVGLFIIKEICDRLGYTIDISTSSTLGGAKISIEGLR